MIANPTLILLLISNALASIGTGVAMIAIPWFLATGEGGSVLFGVLATIVNIFLFFLTPFIGPYIDGCSRQKLMIGLRLAFLLGLVLVYAIFAFSDNTTASLILYYSLGAVFYAFNVPLRTAYVQELFAADEYARINSILEVENQVAAVSTGALAILVMEYLGLSIIILGNVACYIVAVFCIARIKHPAKQFSLKSQSIFKSFNEGVQIALRKPVLALMLLVSSIPYVVIILYTVLHPIALSQIPQASGSTYAVVELLFGLGAILGGWIMISGRFKGVNTELLLLYSLGLFLLVVSFQVLFPTYWGFIVLACAFGFSNSVVRILRQTLLMQQTTASEIGRIGALLQGWIMLMRALCLFVMTLVLSASGVLAAIYFTLFIAILAPVIFLPAYLKKNRAMTQLSKNVGATNDLR
ncbi:MAG: MFS transporter [Pseudomonadales bacterium]|nr:MFS transporter [Pseudomonadales bacterium]NRA18365.1 MFS transporter [Oceanospirillaceae bacterium]